MAQTNRSSDAYNVGIICAASFEAAAAEAMLDEIHLNVPNTDSHHIQYTCGRIGKHNVVIGHIADQTIHTSSVADLADEIRSRFPIKIGFVVGTGSGLPSKSVDIRLGDVVVSQPADQRSGVVQWQFIETKAGNVFSTIGRQKQPPSMLLGAVARLQQLHKLQASEVRRNVRHAMEQYPSMAKVYNFQGRDNDLLFQKDYQHVGQGMCKFCDTTRVVDRTSRLEDDTVEIHYGTIASGNTVVKDGNTRDHISHVTRAICFQKGAAEVVARFPYIVICGVCDYADSHNNKRWRYYAAITAAALMKELLGTIDLIEIEGLPELRLEQAASERPRVTTSLEGSQLAKQLVERQKQMQQMKAQFPDASKPTKRRILVVQGRSGVGKTQFCEQFASTQRERFSSIFWLDGSSKDVLRLSIVDAYYRMLHSNPMLRSEQRDVQRTINRFIEWLGLSDNTQWLVIFDNVDREWPSERTHDQDFDVRDFLPVVDHGNVIMISRRLQVQQALPCLRLKPLRSPQAWQVILNRVGKRFNVENDLLKELCGLPLALSQAGAYIAHTKISAQAYLESYKKMCEEVQKYYGFIYPILITWRLTYLHVSQIHPLAARLLELWTFLDPSNVSYELAACFKQIQKRKQIPEWALNLSNAALFKEAVDVLYAYSLVTTDKRADTYCIHRSNHNLVLTIIDLDHQRQELNRCAIEVVAELARQKTEKLSDGEVRLAQHCGAIGNTTSFGLSESCAFEAYEVAKFLNRWEISEKVERLYLCALGDSKKDWCRDHMLTMNILTDLGLLYMRRGRLKEAETVLLRALSREQKIFGNLNASTLSTIKNLSNLHSRQDKTRQGPYLVCSTSATREEHTIDYRLAALNKASGVSGPTVNMGNFQRIFSPPNELETSTSLASSGTDGTIQLYIFRALTDNDLHALLSHAVKMMSHDGFVRNHHRLLESFYLDLVASALDKRQIQAVHILKSKHWRLAVSSRVYISLYVNEFASIESSALKLETLDAITHKMDTTTSTGTGTIKQSLIQCTADNAEDHDAGSSSDFSSESENEMNTENIRPDFVTFETIEQCFFESQAFERYKSNVRRFIHPRSPKILKKLVSDRDIGLVKKALEEDFALVAQENFDWLVDLHDAGYGFSELAELLVDVEADCPWNFVEPSGEQEYSMSESCHQPSCGHVAPFEHVGMFQMHERLSLKPEQQSDIKRPDFTPEQQNDIKRFVMEHCGLAGIVPLSRAPSEWDGEVDFLKNDGHTTAVISYGFKPSTKPERDLPWRLQQIGIRLCNAFGLLQHSRACCNSFTLLKVVSHLTQKDRSLDLCCIGADSIRVMLERLRQVREEGSTVKLQQLSMAADNILKEVVPNEKLMSNELPPTLKSPGRRQWEERVWHETSLALQISCLGLLSYVRAHIAPFQTFLLDTAVDKVVLMGAECVDILPGVTKFTRICTEIVQPTCLGDMIQSPVLAFHACEDTATMEGKAACDVFASPVDLVDTWGPACLISDASSVEVGQVKGIEIGGGILTRSSNSPVTLHWNKLRKDQELVSSLDAAEYFQLNSKVWIGAIQVNSTCPMQKETRQLDARKACAEYLYELGTSSDRWFAKPYVGVQAGQWSVIEVGANFEKLEGLTVKNRILRRLERARPQICSEDLDAYYGLELSLCTGVARRIPLRILLADTLPAYVASIFPEPPEWSNFGDGLVSALRTLNLAAWFSKSRKEHVHTAILTLGNLLYDLKDTGLDSDHILNVAWIYPGQVQKCFKLACEDANFWAQILEDTEYCATFACITTACFESGSLRCQAANLSHWRNISEMLDTEVCRHVSNCYTKATQTRQPFDLLEGKYWIGPISAGLLASVSNAQSLVLEISRDYLARVPEKHLRRIKFLSRAKRERIRERGATNDNTIEVAIRAHRVQYRGISANQSQHPTS